MPAWTKTFVAEQDEQREQAGDLQQLRRLVERRLLQDELVALVEAADLADEDRDRARRAGPRRPRSAPASQTTTSVSASERRQRVGHGERAPVEALADVDRDLRGALGDPHRRPARGARPEHVPAAEPARPRRGPNEQFRLIQAGGILNV